MHTLVSGGGQHGGFGALGYRKIKHCDAGKLGNYHIRVARHICEVSMSFMISGSRASIFHPCQLIEAILMCMEPSILFRYRSCCISALACNMPVVEIIVIVLIIVIIVIISY